MTARMPLREWLARGWYELQPVVVDGIEISFDDAPVPALIVCYQRADQALDILTSEQEVAA